MREVQKGNCLKKQSIDGEGLKMLCCMLQVFWPLKFKAVWAIAVESVIARYRLVILARISCFLQVLVVCSAHKSTLTKSMFNQRQTPLLYLLCIFSLKEQ